MKKVVLFLISCALFAGTLKAQKLPPSDRTRTNQVLADRAIEARFFLAIPSGPAPVFPAYIPDSLMCRAVYNVDGTGSLPKGIYRYNCSTNAWEIAGAAGVDTSALIADILSRNNNWTGSNQFKSFRVLTAAGENFNINNGITYIGASSNPILNIDSGQFHYGSSGAGFTVSRTQFTYSNSSGSGISVTGNQLYDHDGTAYIKAGQNISLLNNDIGYFTGDSVASKYMPLTLSETTVINAGVNTFEISGASGSLQTALALLPGTILMIDQNTSTNKISQFEMTAGNETFSGGTNGGYFGYNTLADSGASITYGTATIKAGLYIDTSGMYVFDQKKHSGLKEGADYSANYTARNYISKGYADAHYAVSGSGGPPTGSAGGDLTGTFPNPTVNTINGITKSYYDPTSSIQTQLNSKQGTLISGTNIQTINGNSILGSGNMSITASGSAGGDLTGTFPNPTVNTINGITKSYYDPTSSIQTQLNSKQATLISATNIKTINGVSLLGSGNMSVAPSVTVSTFAAMIALGTPSIMTLYKVTADETQGNQTIEYRWWPDNTLMFIASQPIAH